MLNYLVMYLGVDIGGTKTLIAALDEDGVIVEQIKIASDPDYPNFLENFKSAFASLQNQDFKAGAIAVTGPRTDRINGTIPVSTNLPWENVPVRDDIAAVANCPLLVENDAKLAALSEAMLLKDKYKVVLYVTVSTGIGCGLVVDGKIDRNVGDPGGKTMMLEKDGKMLPWEDFASGKAITEQYGKQAKDIDDPAIWETIATDLAKGFVILIGLLQPEIIVIGGSVGNYFDRYGDMLRQKIEEYNIPLVELPVIAQAQRPDEAVIYGCYDLAKSNQ